MGQHVTYELVLRTRLQKPGLAEILKQIMIGAGFAEGEIIEIHDGLRLGVAVYLADARRARAVKRDLSRRGMSGVNVELKRLRRKDWITGGRDKIQPFHLGKKFVVVPEHQSAKFLRRRPGRRQPILIDYGMVFGTGQHATTRFMAQLIESRAGRFVTCLDIGTGTGILAIVAFKCGARAVTAVDISADAIASARRHLRRNACPSADLRVADFRTFPARKFDLVAANLITPDLVACGRKLAACVKPGGYLAVSGISIALYALFREEFSRFPLKCLRVLKGEGWCAVLFRKKTE